MPCYAVAVFATLREMRSRYGLRLALERKVTLWKNRVIFPSTQRTLVRDMQRIGIRPGDLVLVHSAFSKLGYVQGGPETFVAALREIIGPEGTIMMPAFPFNSPAYEYARNAPVFDVLRTPAAVGNLQERFRTMPGTVRSLHPTHSFCAAGKHAKDLVAGHHLAPRPFGTDTPLGRFVDLAGKTLMVGVGLKNFSPPRVIEDILPDYPYPIYHPDPCEFRVRDENGHEFVVRTPVHSPDLAPLRKNNVFKEPLTRQGLISEGKIGLADCLYIRSDGLLDLLRSLVAAGVTPYNAPPGMTR